MKVKISALFFLFLLTFQQSFAQKLCGISEPTTLEKQEMLTRFQDFIAKQAQNKKAKQQIYRVAVRANIVYEDETQKGLTENDVRTIIIHANTYLINSNIELYLLRDSVKTIINSKFANFSFASEKDLRAKYDVLDGINVYFLKTITQTDLSVLNGYSSFPNLSAFSNRIFYAYNNRTTEDYNNLFYKLFLHEMGHYFGLLHTFQDGNSPNIAARELVTRGAGSNCTSTGDQLCDTPSDPFDRIQNFSVYSCAEQVPTSLKDAFGDSYSPPVDNIMSYFLKCGNNFTPQQYQKMQASFALRFSPYAEYRIIAQSPNTISILRTDKRVYCVGDSLKMDFLTTGYYDANNGYYVEISDKNGTNFTRVDSKRTSSQFMIGIPNFEEGDNYRVRIIATSPETLSPISENFSIKTFTTATLSSKTNAIYKGDSIQFSVNFTGSGLWTFQLSDGMLVKDTRQNPYTFYKKPDNTTNYSLFFAKNMCGYGAASGNVNVTVSPPQITSISIPQTSFCAGETFTIKLNIAGKFPSDNQFFVQMSDKNGLNYINLPTETKGNVLTTQIPTTQGVGKGYRLKVNTLNPYSFSGISEPITIVNPPVAPTTTNVSFCQNSISGTLIASGLNLKWYLSDSDAVGYDQLIPSTAQAGKFTYYVTQSDPLGCESKKSSIDVTIRPLPTATISGDRTITLYDSVAVNINFTGEVPIEYSLSNNKIYNTTNNSATLYLKPSKSTVYALQSVRNLCGFGKIYGVSNIMVLQPLATTEEEKGIKIYPNPVNDKLFVELQMSTSEKVNLRLTDIQGKELFYKNVIGTNTSEPESIDFQHLPSGLYFLKIESSKSSYVRKIVK